jgi:predicted unusual protein kinase regulating ubiquinone biosynthesis (AarF/ABC1/UbiB family)
MIRTRYRRIVIFFAGVISNFIFWDLFLARIGLRALARSTRVERMRRSAVRFRKLAIEMGGVMIKVGQFLSTRVDVLPAEITAELADLQDEVPPADFEGIRKEAEAELGGPLEEIFASFEQEPLAAASLGQVHRAQLHTVDNPPIQDQDGNPILDVVVKIQRPGIADIITTDLAALRTVGNWLKRYRPISRRANVPALLDEFTRVLYEEVDYLAEGRNAETFAVNFAGQADIRVPKVDWTHTTQRVLTLENVWSIKITDYEAISEAGIDRSEVAVRLLDTYLQQIFEDGFFHADPHPGNLFVRPLPVEEDESAVQPWQLTFIDFGMVGRVPVQIKEGLREMLIGVGMQDAHRVVQSYMTLGILLPGADLEALERAESKIFERFWGKNMTELSRIDPAEVRDLMIEFRELIYTLPFQVPQDIIFLVRTVSILSGMCTGLNPKFNLFDQLVPYAQKLISEEIRVGETLLKEARDLVRVLVSIPLKMDTMLGKMSRGEIAIQTPEVSRQVKHLENNLRQINRSIVFAALFIGGVQLYLAHAYPFGELLLAFSILGLLWGWITGRRR